MYRQFNSVPVYANPNTGAKYQSKVDGAIRFDSTSEYKFWLLLRRLFTGYIIVCHPKLSLIGGRNWKIDFVIKPCDKQQGIVLHKLKNYLNGNTVYDNDYGTYALYLEYKGQIDDNFNEKMKYIQRYDATLFSNICLVGKYPSAYVIEDLQNIRRYIKLISTPNYLEKLCQTLR